MKIIVYILLIKVIGFSGGQLITCNDPYVLVNNICYYFSPSDTVATWLEAREACHKIGGGLAVLDTAEKNEAVGLYIQNNADFTTFSHWIALNDQTTEGNYIWDGLGTQAVYTNWHHLYGNTTYNCIIATLYNNYGWEDGICTSNNYYICQQRESQNCEAPFVARGKSCYYFDVGQQQTWSYAHDYCNSINSSLLSIDSEYENTIVTNYLTEAYPAGDYFWIGAYDQGHEGQWVWENSGNPVDITNWLDGYPTTDTNSNCAWTTNEGWSDHSCYNSFAFFICEKPLY